LFTPKSNFFSEFIKGILGQEQKLGLWVGRIMALLANRTLPDLAVELIIYELKEGFLWGIYRSFVGEK